MLLNVVAMTYNINSETNLLTIWVQILSLSSEMSLSLSGRIYLLRSLSCALSPLILLNPLPMYVKKK